MSEETIRYYAWVRVGDGHPEPAVIQGKNGERTATTLSCPDPFRIDEPDCPCQILFQRASRFVKEATIEPPYLISRVTAEKAERVWKRYLKNLSRVYDEVDPRP